MTDQEDSTERPALDLGRPPRHLAERLAGFTMRLRRHIPELTAAEATFLLVEMGLDAAESPDVDPEALVARWRVLRD